MAASVEPSIGQRIRACYLRRGFNRNTFAKAMDVHYTNVAAWERGAQNPSRANVSLAAEILGVPEAELYGYSMPVRDYPAYHEWLETMEGQHASDDVRAALAAQRWLREPTLMNYHYAYIALTYGLPIASAAKAAEETRAAHDAGERSGGTSKKPRPRRGHG